MFMNILVTVVSENISPSFFPLRSLADFVSFHLLLFSCCLFNLLYLRLSVFLKAIDPSLPGVSTSSGCNSNQTSPKDFWKFFIYNRFLHTDTGIWNIYLLTLLYLLSYLSIAVPRIPQRRGLLGLSLNLAIHLRMR